MKYFLEMALTRSEKEILLNLINIALEGHDFILEANNIAVLKDHRNVLLVEFV